MDIEQNTEKTYVIIVAAGTGQRFGSDIPKQFLEFGSEKRPVLMHTIDAFRKTRHNFDIVLVISREMVDFWNNLCEKHNFVSPPVVFGGATRFESVKNALKEISLENPNKILIHDGVRPLVSEALIARILTALNKNDAVIPVTPVTDSLRVKTSDRTLPVDRSKYVAVQTPQGFSAEILFSAYNRQYSPEYTDDASVVESNGHPVATVEGDTRNIKITNSQDLRIAEVILLLSDTNE